MINSRPPFGPEAWRTVRAAIRDGWGSTARLVILLAALTAFWIGFCWVTGQFIGGIAQQFVPLH